MQWYLIGFTRTDEDSCNQEQSMKNIPGLRELRYLWCDKGHSTYYNDVNEMGSKCPVCGSTIIWPASYGKRNERGIKLVMYGIIAIVFLSLVVEFVINSLQ